jgi:hypothetical protein
MEADASLSKHLDDAFGAIHASCGPVESLFGPLAVVAPGQALAQRPAPTTAPTQPPSSARRHSQR